MGFIIHRIWEYLSKISGEQGKTIIISTHYIEETRFCDKACELILLKMV